MCMALESVVKISLPNEVALNLLTKFRSDRDDQGR